VNAPNVFSFSHGPCANLTAALNEADKVLSGEDLADKKFDKLHKTLKTLFW
jgi:hypothetical protein